MQQFIIKDPYTYLKAKALRLLARRDHSRAELKQKLLQKLPEEVALVEKILDECEKSGWQNELRFAQSFIRARAQRFYGPIKIRYELKQRSVSDDIINHAFDEAEVDWQQLADEARIRKFGEAKPSSWQEKAKQMQYLYQRGFDTRID